MPAYDGRYEDAIGPFVDAMRHKLAVNAHKGRWEDADTGTLLRLARGELDELEEALASGNRIEILLEAADVANLAMMVADITIRQMGQMARGEQDAPPTLKVGDAKYEVDFRTGKSIVDPNPAHYTRQGRWSPREGVDIQMWLHRTLGYTVFEDHQEVRDQKLRMAPWTELANAPQARVQGDPLGLEA